MDYFFQKGARVLVDFFLESMSDRATGVAPNAPAGDAPDGPEGCSGFGFWICSMWILLFGSWVVGFPVFFLEQRPLGLHSFPDVFF